MRITGLYAAIAGGALVAALVVVLATRKGKETPAPTPPPAAPTAPTDDRAKLLEDARRLETEGKGEEALAAYRELLRRDPSSKDATDAVSRLEAGVAAHAEQEKKAKDVEAHLAAARAAALEGDDAKVVAESEAALAIDAQNAEGAVLKTGAEERLAAATKKTADQAAKKAEIAKKKAKPTAPPKVASVPAPAPARPVEAAVAPTPTPGTGTIRISFDSPISQGYVMVRLNDKEIFQKAFDFGKKNARGRVEGSTAVPSGRGEFKVWVIASDRSVNEYKVVPATVPGGESRTLALELDAARHLNVNLK